MISLLIIGFVTLRIIDGKAEVMEWVIAVFCLPFLIVLLRPKTWTRPIWLVADRHGLYFFGSLIEQGYTFVPWHEVSDEMSIEKIATGNGLTKGVVIKVEGRSSFWKPATESMFLGLLLQPVQPDGYRRLPLTKLGHNLKRSVEALSYLHRHSSSQPKHEH